ncbi:MAG TPA: CHAT domain-containing protein, partial [Acidimicrobiales bacterium]
AGTIELADEDGAALTVSASDLTVCFQTAGKAIPLVFVSACTTGQSATGLAYELHRLGVARVLAMQAPVSDRYATELAAAFYAQLSTRPAPRAGVALAAGRREAETARSRDPARVNRPEWATPTLLLAGDDEPLIDPDLELVQLATPAMSAGGMVPMLAMGELIGRRRELRTTLRALRGDHRFTDEHGEVAGVMLTGIGGVGKSSIAGRAMARLTEGGWLCSATTGTWSLETVCAQLGADLSRARQVWARQERAALADLPADDRYRIAWLATLLGQHRVLLVFDNFEDNLVVGGGAFLDEPAAEALQGLLDSCASGKVLVTSRHPLPVVIGLHEVPVGPLSPAETRRLFLRLPGLQRLAPDDVALVAATVGGHPRALELLDALLRKGASLRRVGPKLRDLARREGIDTSAGRDLAAALSDTVRLAARDIVLDELLEVLDDTERQVLLQVAVSGLPVPADGLATGLEDAGVIPAALEAAAARLGDLSLVVVFDGGLWVHRWTAEAIRRREPAEDYRRRCERAGRMRLRGIESGPADIAEGIEATENFLAAQLFDEAAGIAMGVAEFLSGVSTLHLLSFSRRVRQALPTSHVRYKNVADYEAKALLALGFTTAALERYGELVHDLEALAEAERDRADYQR